MVLLYVYFIVMLWMIKIDIEVIYISNNCNFTNIQFNIILWDYFDSKSNGFSVTLANSLLLDYKSSKDGIRKQKVNLECKSWGSFINFGWKNVENMK